MSKLETTKSLIKANAKRVIEILENSTFEKKYGVYTGPTKAELINKMLEIRRDTKRLEHILNDQFKNCLKCTNEFNKNSMIHGLCWDCYRESETIDL